MRPYYSDDLVTIYHGDCLPHLLDDDFLAEADVIVTDPPFGISYRSNKVRREGNARSIAGDEDPILRDLMLARWAPGPALVFGSWKVRRPGRTKMPLIWDAGPAVGMGDLSLPWKPCFQEIYVIGSGFKGKRTTGVLRHPPVQTVNRDHPHEKPVSLLRDLLRKCHPDEWVALDPFMGVGTTLQAATDLGMRAIGIEVEERYCEIAAQRCSQEVLAL